MTNTNQHRKIRATMMQHGVTCTGIAQSLGFSDTYVTFVVTGRRTGYKVRRAIAAACQVPVEELWPDTPLVYRKAA